MTKKEKLQQLIIEKIFDGENTTNGIDEIELDNKMSDLLDELDLGLWCSLVGHYDNQECNVFFYDGDNDILLGGFKIMSIEGITETLLNYIEAVEYYNDHGQRY